MAIRVPTAAVSLVEINAQTSRPLDSLEFRWPGRALARIRGGPAGWLGVSDVSLVSVDFKGDPELRGGPALPGPDRGPLSSAGVGWRQ